MMTPPARRLVRTAMLLLVAAASLPPAVATPEAAGCAVTFQGRHGGAAGGIDLPLGSIEVRTRVGWWSRVRPPRARASDGAVRLEPGDHFSEVYTLDLACNAHRRYRFTFVAYDGERSHEHTYYYPSEDGFTQETFIDLGALSRFFPWIEPAADAEPQPVTLSGIDLGGEWVRSESNNDPNDGMRIRVEADRAVLTFAPTTAGNAWREGRLLWREIGGDGALRVLGSDGNYYPSRLTLRDPDRLTLSVGHGGAGNDQTWVRASDADGGAASDRLVTRQQGLSVERSSIWTNREIPVCWENFNQSYSTPRRWTREAVEETWEREANVDFTGWGECRASSRGIRIRVADVGPHVKRLGSRLDGVRNGMVLNFTFGGWNRDCANDREDCIRNIAVHEFGHALGIAHEQNRADAPLRCMEEQGTDGDWSVTPYDVYSVMNYCNPEWGGDGQLSPGDIMGAVRLYGSADGNRLGLYEEGDAFGAALAVGDFDGDGYDDLAVGAPGEAIGSEAEAGAVFLFRGTLTGGLRPWASLTQAGLGNDERGDRFGAALAAGDFDGDGYDDLAVGAPGESPGDGPQSGAVFLFRGSPSGVSPWQSLTQSGLDDDEFMDAFGTALAAGDFDGDGLDDLAVGAPGKKLGDGVANSGAVFIFRGASPELEPWRMVTPERLSPSGVGDRFGSALAVGVFHAGGGAVDLVVGAPGKRVDGVRAGAVFVFDGGRFGLRPSVLLDQTGLGRHERGDRFGAALAVGDFDGDGDDDLAVGAPGEAPGSDPASGAVFVFRSELPQGGLAGLTGWAVLDQGGLGRNEEGDRFGAALASGDFDGDGKDDLVVGAPGEAPGGHPASGAVFAFRGGAAGLAPLVVLDQTGLGRNEEGDGLGTALAVGRFSQHAGAHLAVGAPGAAPGDEPAAGFVFMFAELAVDLKDSSPWWLPLTAQPPRMQGWYAFGQQY